MASLSRFVEILSSRDAFLNHPRTLSFISSIIRQKKFQLTKLRTDDREWLDIGCGPTIDPKFINVDYIWRPGIDICWDVTKGLPLDSGRVRGIFTEHCLEHLPFKAMPLVLKEFYRVLKPGGRLRIIVPDVEVYLTRYVDMKRGSHDVSLPYAAEDQVDGFYTPALSVNRIFYSHGHQFIYDFDIFKYLLEKIGFVDVKKCEYNMGEEPMLIRDNEYRAEESLYVEATRPVVAQSS